MSRRGAWAFVATALALAFACGPREEIVHVSADGVAILVGGLSGGVCDQPLAQTSETVCSRALCVWSSGKCGACAVDSSVKTRVSPPTRGVVIQLILVDAVSRTVKNRSLCTPIRSCAPSDSVCLQSSVNDAIGGAIGGGLGYSGLKDTNDSLLVLAAFEQTDGVADCDPSTLLGCAGMGKRAGTGETDVLCSSGNGGLALSPNSDPTRCPVPKGSGFTCFAQVCAQLLRK